MKLKFLFFIKNVCTHNNNNNDIMRALNPLRELFSYYVDDRYYYHKGI